MTKHLLRGTVGAVRYVVLAGKVYASVVVSGKVQLVPVDTESQVTTQNGEQRA